MSSLLAKNPPKNEAELLERCKSIAGLSFAQLASGLGLVIVDNPLQRKGWVGQAIELALGTTASNHSLPDFHHLGIELKTLPIGQSGKAVESTFICSIPLLTINQQSWSTSQCYNKLKRVLWLPIEGDTDIAFHQRRIGMGFLWSPDSEDEHLLKSDWTYLSNMLSLGQLEDLDARHGEALQIRPKAATGQSLCYFIDHNGEKQQTLPRGFYLRSTFTAKILESKK